MQRRASLFVTMLLVAATAAAEDVNFTYLWHLEQPIYWPDRQTSGEDRYERAWESIQRTDGGAAHPSNNLRDIFGKDDRVAVYQYRVRDCISSISWSARAGAQVSYSGGLIENIQSLGGAGQLGYSSGWYNSLREARGWTTSGGKPRCDIVLFGFHHPLLPLLDDSAVRKEIQLYRQIYGDAWGAAPTQSRGLFPSEMAFSERLIKVLDEEGVDWVVVSNEHISRACADFPLVLGSGGVNCEPPNVADVLNPAQTNYLRLQIDRGCSPANAYPYAYTPHYARYVDPDTGTEHRVIVIPAAQALGWKDGYSPLGLNEFGTLQGANDPSRPQLVLLAHDGDNAWGGGYSYYMEAVPNFVGSASGSGYVPTTIEQYLSDHPVPWGDVTHVEDGAWVNADGDFGSPTFLNWNWPLVNLSGQVDIPNGWAEDERNWAVITAAQNRVDTAEQIAGGVNLAKVLYPDGSTSNAERAWHYFLASLNSGYMYYGTAEDFEVKPTIACNRAMEYADPVIGDTSLDQTPPTVWIPQRFPYNPGSLNFGPSHGYQQVSSNGDFWVWTFVYDVSGVTNVTLKYRLDNDAVADDNRVYGDPNDWVSLPMNARVFPTGNVYNDPSIDFFELPDYIADQYHVEVTGLSEVFVDYYVEAVDGKGHVRRSPIQHVYVGDGSGSSGGDDIILLDPNEPVAGQALTIQYNPTGRPLDGAASVYLHYGYDNWNPVISPDPQMNWNATDSVWQTTVNVPGNVGQIDMVFNDGQGNWDNNGGADWHFPVTGGEPVDEWVMDGQLDGDAALAAQNGALVLYAGLKGTTLYVAALDAGEGNDHFIFVADPPGALQSAPWAKAGQVAGWSAYLADENDNDFVAWFDAAAFDDPATGPNGGYMEGTLKLVAEFGAVPEVVYLAFAPYGTSDGSALVYDAQCPPSLNDDDNLDAGEYALFIIGSTRIEAGDMNCDGLINYGDIDPFVVALTNPTAYDPAYPGCYADLADCNRDGLVNNGDIDPFVALLTGG